MNDKPNALAEAALALDRELRRYEELSQSALRMKLNTEKNLERATEGLQRAAESQDRINSHVQQLVAAVQAARQKQESDAESLMKRAHEIAARRGEFAELLQQMAGLGTHARDIQELLKSGTVDLDELVRRMEQVAEAAQKIEESASAKQMEDLQRQAETLRQQVLSARNKVSLLKKTPQTLA
jgi:chromosome segregation ATPase